MPCQNVKTYYVERVSCCARRRMDMERIVAYLSANGLTRCDKPDKVDLIVAIMCVSTETNIQSSKELIHKLSRDNATAKIVVSGCLIHTMVLSVVREIPNVIAWFPPKKGLETLDLILQFPIKMSTVSDPASFDEAPETLIIRAQWGCQGKCTYCVARNSIGATVSKSIERCVEEVERRLTAEKTKIRIMGDDLGSYGVDLGTNLIALLTAIDRVRDGRKMVLDNIDVRYLVKFEKDILAMAERGVFLHIQSPMQHVVPRILESMGRYSGSDKVRHVVNQLVRVLGVHMETHFIVGFPTEEDDELRIGVSKLIDEFSFGRMGFYPYMDNEETVSYGFDKKVSRKDTISRMDAIYSIVSSIGRVETRAVPNGGGLYELRVMRPGYVSP